MKSDIISKILKETPLEIRLNVDNEFAFINLITELGFREDKMWEDCEDPMLRKLIMLANELTKRQIKTIERWEKDGKPI